MLINNLASLDEEGGHEPAPSQIVSLKVTEQTLP